MARLLIVDDEKNIRQNLASFLESCGHEVKAAQSGPEAVAMLSELGEFDLVLTDFRMAEMNGLELLQEIRRRVPDSLVVLMTAYATVENAVAAMKGGAYDYLTKPFSLRQIQHLVERALEVKSLRSENRILRSTIDGVSSLESRSPTMKTLLDTAQQAAASDATILLNGESGTGKNLLAKQIHDWSPRRDNPFVVVNCTTISEHLLESELFGHVRGAFTGAVKDKPGRLEAADRGTVFLDEIADLPQPLQTKLLRFLHEQRFERVGGQQTIQVNARIIAASNRDLYVEVSAGRFRADLFYRLNVIVLRVPALRERPEDILPLAQRFLAAARVRNRRPALQLSPEAAGALLRHAWPGNVRELLNAIERATVLSRGSLIGREDLPDSVFQPSCATLPAHPDAATLDEVEREHIRRTLAQAATLEEAADTLGISIATLWRKRRRYHID